MLSLSVGVSTRDLPALRGPNRGEVILEVITLNEADLPRLDVTDILGHIRCGHGPAPPRAEVGVAAVHQSSVEEDRSARFELDRDLAAEVDLVVAQNPPLDRVLVVRYITVVRARDQVQAAVFNSGRI